MTVGPDPIAESFIASRWTKGNLFFPTRIVVTPEHVLRVKPRLFGSTQESIAIPAVASVRFLPECSGPIYGLTRLEGRIRY